MRKSILATAVAAAFAWAGAASAGPLNPDLSSMANPLTTANGTQLAGEGAAPNFKIGSTVEGFSVGAKAIQHVDWVVRRDTTVDALGGYVYYYQLENSSVLALSNLLIGSGFFTSVALASVPVDFDVAAAPGVLPHNSLNFTNLAGVPTHDYLALVNVDENETTSTGGGLATCGTSSAPISFRIAIGANGGSISSFFPEGLEVGCESFIIVGTGPRPVYGDFLTTGAFPGTSTLVGWSSDNGNPLGGEVGMEIAVPGAPQVVPEPGSILLLGSGLLGAGFWLRRRKQS